MSRLDDLIAELCPDGVEFKHLGDVCLNTANISWAANENKTFRYIDLTSVARETHSIRDTTAINLKNAPSRAQKVVKADDVIFGTTRPTLRRYCFIPTNYDGQICSTGYCVLRADKTQVLPRYIYHLISTTEFYTYVEANQRGSAYPAISNTIVKAYTIPVPPLPVQHEIVRILDKFTVLEAELKAELEAELEARKKQYEYYRDKLFTFDDSVEWKALGEIGEVTKLAGFEFSEHVRYSDKGSIIALRGLNIKKGRLDLSNVKYIDDSNFTKLSRSKLYVNDMIFTYVGTIGEVALIDEDDKYYLAPNVARIRFLDKNINPAFMRFYFQTHYFFDKQINRYLETSSMKNLTMENIRKFQIPFPSLAEQERIVAILDRFDTLVNDITTDLPAEITARRKQYEYYRDKLLTFKEAI